MKMLNPPSSSRKLYALFGLKSDASEQEIHDAYVKICKEHHPDKHNGVVSDFFDAVTHAYAILSDEEKRREYDETELDPNEVGNKELLDAAKLIRKLAQEAIVAGHPPEAILHVVHQVLVDDKLASISRLGRAETRKRELDYMLIELTARFEGPDFIKGSVLGAVLEEIESAGKDIAATNITIEEFDTAINLVSRCQYHRRRASGIGSRVAETDVQRLARMRTARLK